MPVDRNKITPWQREQLDALRLVRHHLDSVALGAMKQMRDSLADYLEYRAELDAFLNRYFSHICTQSCYANQRSACCGKDGIIAFFAEVVINAMISDKEALNRLETVLQKPNPGTKCIFLGAEGCLWRLRPIVCALFLCDPAETAVFDVEPSLQTIWANLKKREKTFKWPDRVVLFDEIEKYYISKGCQSPLMYCHNSPGLLRIKKTAQKNGARNGNK